MVPDLVNIYAAPAEEGSAAFAPTIAYVPVLLISTEYPKLSELVPSLAINFACCTKLFPLFAKI